MGSEQPRSYYFSFITHRATRRQRSMSPTFGRQNQPSKRPQSQRVSCLSSRTDLIPRPAAACLEQTSANANGLILQAMDGRIYIPLSAGEQTPRASLQQLCGFHVQRRRHLQSGGSPYPNRQPTELKLTHAIAVVHSSTHQLHAVQAVHVEPALPILRSRG